MSYARIVALGAILLSSSAFAHDYKVGDLVIIHPWSRATPKSAPVAVGYLTIRNTGTTPDRLIGVTTDRAKEGQVHEMTMDGGVMKMRALPKGLEIPAGGTVELKPGGYHLMFMNPTRPFVAGEMIKATLDFEHAGKEPVEFLVGSIGATVPPKDGETPMNKDDAHDAHGGMNMSH